VLDVRGDYYHWAIRAATITQTSIVNTILSGTSLAPKFAHELQGFAEVFGFYSWGEQFSGYLIDRQPFTSMHSIDL
jgi:hypothetical protein